LLLDRAGWHVTKALKVPNNTLAPAIAGRLTRAQSAGEHLAVHAGELALQPCLQILRRYRRPLLLRLEHAYRSAMENNVHRPIGPTKVTQPEDWYKTSSPIGWCGLHQIWL
jgi:hypothetical protein